MEEVALTRQERDQLMAVLRELDGGAPVEQRRAPRRRVFIHIAVRSVSAEERKLTLLRGTVCNIAQTGVGIRLRKPLAEGSKFMLPLRFREGGGWLVLCEVRNCEKIGEREYRVGGRFVDRIDDPTGESQPPMDWLM